MEIREGRERQRFGSVWWTYLLSWATNSQIWIFFIQSISTSFSLVAELTSSAAMFWLTLNFRNWANSKNMNFKKMYPILYKFMKKAHIHPLWLILLTYEVNPINMVYFGPYGFAKDGILHNQPEKDDWNVSSSFTIDNTSLCKQTYFTYFLHKNKSNWWNGNRKQRPLRFIQLKEKKKRDQLQDVPESKRQMKR